MPFIGSEYRHPDEFIQPAKAGDEPVSLYAFAKGDMSVGIPHSQWTIEDVGSLDDYEGQREDVRKAFSDAFALLTGESKVQVRFSDEQATD